MRTLRWLLLTAAGSVLVALSVAAEPPRPWASLAGPAPGPAFPAGPEEPALPPSRPPQAGNPPAVHGVTEQWPISAPVEAPADSAADLAKRLADVEQRLKDRDATEKKAAAAAEEKRLEDEWLAADPAKKKFVVRPFGRIQADVASFDQDAANQATVGNALNGVDIRRARLGVEGEGYDRFFYRLDVDFVTFDPDLDTRPTIFDAYLDAQKLPLVGNLRVGHFREPFSLQRLDSSNDFPFMERAAAINSLAPARNMGVMAFDWNEAETCTLAAGVFAENTDEYGEELSDRSGIAFTTRGTLLPWYEEHGCDLFLFHVGASYSYRRLGDPQRGFDQTPEIQIKEGPTVTPNFIDTGTLPLEEYHVAGAEAVTVLGGWSFQGEYICVAGQQLTGESLFLQGAYFETTCWLTGEHRKYLRRLGIFGAVTPLSPLVCLDECCRHNGWGAWEAKARVSWADFDDGTVQGGDMTIFAVGFNWYYTVRSRVLFDYLHPLLDRGGRDSAANIFAMRFQVAF